MSFIDYGNPENGQSAFPKDFGSKAAMHRADSYRREISQQQIADRKAKRLERQAFRAAMRSKDPGAMREAAKYMRGNPGAWGINTAQENRAEARQQVDARRHQYNTMVSDSDMSASQKQDMYVDRFGMTGKQGREAQWNSEQEQQRQDQREQKFSDLLESGRAQYKFRSEYGPFDRDPARDPTMGLNTDPLKFFAMPSMYGMRADGGGGTIFHPDSDVRPETPMDLGRYTSAASEFNRMVETDPVAFMPLQREVTGGIAAGRLSRFDSTHFMEKAAQVVRLVRTHGKKLGISLPKHLTAKDVVDLYTQLHSAGLTPNYPLAADLGPGRLPPKARVVTQGAPKARPVASR